MEYRLISNVNSVSALLDRLICENIKLFFFEKDGLVEKVRQQQEIIEVIKGLLSNTLVTAISNQNYKVLSENRTFALVENVEELIHNDIKIGESDRARLNETKQENPSLQVFFTQEQLMRMANEGRSLNKNNIDKLLGEIIN